MRGSGRRGRSALALPGDIARRVRFRAGVPRGGATAGDGLGGREVVSQQYGSGGRARVARGLAGALGQTGEVVFESLPRRATLRLPRGTEFAVVFVDPVTAEAG